MEMQFCPKGLERARNLVFLHAPRAAAGHLYHGLEAPDYAMISDCFSASAPIALFPSAHGQNLDIRTEEF